MKMKVKTKKTAAKKKADPNNVVPIKKVNEIEYTLTVCYRLMREMGHQPMVVAAMLNCLSAGFDLADIEYAARQFGDV
jgi:hypothetical protein